MKVLFFFIALSTACFAEAAEPGEAALAFLKKVKSETVNYNPDTDMAMSPHTGVEKRKTINARLQRMSYDIGSRPLSVGQVKIDDDLAGVLIWKSEGFDPSDMQVFPVAMIQREGQWKPAPVPASFENVDVGFSAETRKRIQALENWMREQMVYDLRKLRSQAIARMRDNISERITEEALKKLNARQVADQFMDACQQRDTYRMLGLLGGLSNTLPDDWAIRARAVQHAMTSELVPVPWSFLISRNSLTVTVHYEEENRNALVSLACLDPGYKSSRKSPPEVQLIHLNLIKTTNGTWQVDLPSSFYLPPSQYSNAGDMALDRELFNAFPKKVRELYPATPQSSPEKARDAFIESLQEGTLENIAQLTHLPEAPDLARASLAEAAELWWGVRAANHSDSGPPSLFMIIPLGMRTQDDAATVSCQWFSARKPDLFQLKLLHFKRHESGWLWTPAPDQGSLEAINEWKAAQTAEWDKKWHSAMLNQCPTLKKIPGKAPSLEVSRKLVQSWLTMVENGNITGALEQCARLNLADSNTTLLRNLGYEMIGAIKRDTPVNLGESFQKGPWTGVGVNSTLSEQPAYPLYPVVQTEHGPKILLEVDLLATGGRGRGFLNRTSIDRLGDFDANAANTLKTLFSDYETKVLGKSTP